MLAAETSVLVGGTVRTLDPERPRAAALVLSGGRVAAVLDDPADAPAGARRVDLAGACVVPGLVDAHVHFPSWALARRELRLFGCRSLAEALEQPRDAHPRAVLAALEHRGRHALVAEPHRQRVEVERQADAARRHGG